MGKFGMIRLFAVMAILALNGCMTSRVGLRSQPQYAMRDQVTSASALVGGRPHRSYSGEVASTGSTMPSEEYRASPPSESLTLLPMSLPRARTVSAVRVTECPTKNFFD